MNGEFISIETAERIAKLEKENKKIKKGLKKAINKVCEQDIVIAETIEYIEDVLNSIWVNEEECLRTALKMLKGEEK